MGNFGYIWFHFGHHYDFNYKKLSFTLGKHFIWLLAPVNTCVDTKNNVCFLSGSKDMLKLKNDGHFGIHLALCKLWAVYLIFLYFFRFLVPQNIGIDIKFVIICCLQAKLCKNLKKGGHFGRHLGFSRLHKGDYWGLLVCDSMHNSPSILQKSACYQICPG